MENEIQFNCPYCGEVNYTEVFIAEGITQVFVQDCEVCCRPVELNIHFNNEGIMNIQIKNDDGF